MMRSESAVFHLPKDLADLKSCLANGAVILYPTEGVLGIGCDPYQEQAVRRIQALKQRDPAKGMITVASAWDQVSAWVECSQVPDLEAIKASFPGPTTWVFPASENAPKWLTAQNRIAIRISAHPTIQAICDGCGMPLVSTSANPSGRAPWCHFSEVEAEFMAQVDGCVEGRIGDQLGPSVVKDALTGRQYR